MRTYCSLASVCLVLASLAGCVGGNISGQVGYSNEQETYTYNQTRDGRTETGSGTRTTVRAAGQGEVNPNPQPPTTQPTPPTPPPGDQDPRRDPDSGELGEGGDGTIKSGGDVANRISIFDLPPATTAHFGATDLLGICRASGLLHSVAELVVFKGEDNIFTMDDYVEFYVVVDSRLANSMRNIVNPVSFAVSAERYSHTANYLEVQAWGTASNVTAWLATLPIQTFQIDVPSNWPGETFAGNPNLYADWVTAFGAP